MLGVDHDKIFFCPPPFQPSKFWVKFVVVMLVLFYVGNKRCCIVLYCIIASLGIIFPMCIYSEFVIQVVQYFGQSLLHGNQHIYQSMPRMLTLWLDYGAEVTEAETRSKGGDVMLQGMRAVLQHLNKV